MHPNFVHEHIKSCASGAISRSQSRNIKAEEDAKDRAIGIMTGKRGTMDVS